VLLTLPDGVTADKTGIDISAATRTSKLTQLQHKYAWFSDLSKKITYVYNKNK
jgi:hypothetical protein